MTDAEVDTLRCDGIHLSTLDSVRARLAAQVAAGTFTQNIADQLFTDSLFQSNQLGARSAKFWMVSHPVDVKDSGVELLLESWGGEAVYFWQRDVMLQEMLTQIGRPRVLEIAMPLARSRHSYSAADAVVATYGRTLGCGSNRKAFDLWTFAENLPQLTSSSHPIPAIALTAAFHPIPAIALTAAFHPVPTAQHRRS